MAKELLNSGKIRTGVEKVPGVAAPQVVRGDAGHPAARARRARSWRIASPLRPPPTRRFPVRSIRHFSRGPPSTAG
ncbi:MAG TPA: hypothetical protein VGR26_10855 [Acidimicrobiales bacterium]|nr:hypothetical protein [Acidimicrobiales bacterium]